MIFAVKADQLAISEPLSISLNLLRVYVNQNGMSLKTFVLFYQRFGFIFTFTEIKDFPAYRRFIQLFPAEYNFLFTFFFNFFFFNHQSVE